MLLWGKKPVPFLCISSPFGTGIYYILQLGKVCRINRSKVPAENASASIMFQDALHHMTTALSGIVVTDSGRMNYSAHFGYLFSKMKQWQLLGEMVAGIVRDPVLGLFAFIRFTLYLSCIFAGQPAVLKPGGPWSCCLWSVWNWTLTWSANRQREAVIISHASIIIPYTFGHGSGAILISAVCPWQYIFLLLCIVCQALPWALRLFPVLARIMQERGIPVRPGTTCITTADDVYCLVYTGPYWSRLSKPVLLSVHFYHCTGGIIRITDVAGCSSAGVTIQCAYTQRCYQ